LYWICAAILDDTTQADLVPLFQRKQTNPADKEANKATNVKELMVEQYFLPFLVSHLRDQKTEGYSIMATEEMTAKLAEMKINVTPQGHYELNKLSKEHYIKFRHHFIEQKGYNKSWMANKNEKAMDMLLSAFCLMMCKKVPTELELRKIEKLHERVRLLPNPCNATSKQVGCVVRLQVPTDDLGEDVEQDNKAVACNSQAKTLPYSVVVLNQ